MEYQNWKRKDEDQNKEDNLSVYLCIKDTCS